MAQYIPKINLPVEGVEHARWLERRSLDQERRIEALERLVDRLLKMGAAPARTATPTETVGGTIPEPHLAGFVLRAFGNGNPFAFTPDWIGLTPEYRVNLDPVGGSSYEVTSLGISVGEENDASPLSKAALPAVDFTDTGAGLTMVQGAAPDVAPFYFGTFPILLVVTVNPSFDGEEFGIEAPWIDNVYGPTAPFFKVSIENPTAFDASVKLSVTGTDAGGIYYAGTSVPLMGVTPETAFTLDAGVKVAWHVELFAGISAAATPVYAGSVDGWLDPYYAANLA